MWDGEENSIYTSPLSFIQRCPHPNPQKLSVTYLTLKRNFADEIKDAGTEDYPGVCTWPDVVTRVLLRGMEKAMEQWKQQEERPHGP